MKLLIKYPTRGRPELFRETILNIHQTIGSEHYTILVTADEVDICDYEGMIKGFPNSDKIILKRGESYNKIHAVNRDMDFAYDKLRWEWLILMSDDMKFVTNNWYDKMLSDIYSRWTDTDFFAHFNDGHTTLSTLSVIGLEWFERTFYIYPWCYGSVSCDAEEHHKAQMLGKYHYFDAVYFKHFHPANGYGHGSIDNTYLMNNKYGEKDTQTYFKRMKKLFYVNNPNTIPGELKQFVSHIDPNN